MSSSQDPSSSGKKEKDPISPMGVEPKKSTPGYEDLVHYVKENTRDSIAYVLMIVGLLLMLFDAYSNYGSFLVGIIFALYFANELVFVATNVKDLIEEYGVVKSLVLSGVLLALLIKLPFLLFGMAVITLLKIFLWPEK
jgi:hypothetical protein